MPELKGLKLSRNLELLLVLTLGILLLAGLFGVNLQYAKNNPGGNDFLVHYIGARSYIFDGLSPYSDQVALRIQTAAYGRAAEGAEHELRVAYPLYSIFLFAPFSLIDTYSLARAVWMTLLELAVIGLVFLSFDLAEWKPGLWVQAGILLFSLVWYHALRSIINGNAVILIALLLAAAFHFIRNQRDDLAGFLLAVTTIKPHLVVLIIPFVIIWTGWQRRWKVLAWFTISLAVLVGLGLALIPNWIYQNLWEVLKYPEYNPAGTLAAALAEWFPAWAVQLKWAIAGVFGLILLVEGWRARRGDFPHFLWTAYLVLTAGQWIGIQTDPGNFILLFPVLILILAIIVKRWERWGQVISGVYLGVLFLVPWLIFLVTIQRSYQPIQSAVMFIPIPLVCLLGLYWVKWWVITPSRRIWKEPS